MAASFKLLDDPISQGLGRVPSGIERQLRRLRRVIRLIDAGEILALSRQRALVQALRIAGDDGLERRLNEDLEELALGRRVAYEPPFGLARGNERAEHD